MAQPYEIIGETIKSATSIKLGEIFRTSTTVSGQTVYVYPHRYKENITSMDYPNFSIVQVDLNVTPQQTIQRSALENPLRRMRLDYLMNIQYRVAENTETITNLQQQLDAVGLKLCSDFTELDLELPTKVQNARYEKADGVLQFFFNITVFATTPKTNDEKMEELSIDEDISVEEE